MSTRRGVDFAWSKPTGAQVRGAGFEFVVCYLSHTSPGAALPAKDLHPDELADYLAHGLYVALVWETTAGRALQGHGAGVFDATYAVLELITLGLPRDMPVHFAVDTDTDWSSVAAYFDGVTQVIPKTTAGAYGSDRITRGAHAYGLGYRWQTRAWSGGRLDPDRTMLQNGAKAFNGAADIDETTVVDYGQYPRPEGADVQPTDKTILSKAQAAAYNAAGHACKEGDPVSWDWIWKWGGPGQYTLAKNAGEIAHVLGDVTQQLANLTQQNQGLLTAISGLTQIVTALAAKPEEPPLDAAALVQALVAALPNADLTKLDTQVRTAAADAFLALGASLKA